MARLQRQLDAFSDGTAHRQARQGTRESAVDWVPVCDLLETAGEYHVVMELPGVRKEEVAIDLHDNTLTISGSKKVDEALPQPPAAAASAAAGAASSSEKKAATAEVKAIKRERPVGKFARSFTVPPNVKAEHIGASFEGGLLRVVISKPKDTLPLKIDIK
jgi:HSP20 family protein